MATRLRSRTERSCGRRASWTASSIRCARQRRRFERREYDRSMTARVHSRDTAAAFDERSAIVLGAVVQLAVVLAGYALTLPFGVSPTLVIVLATIPLWSTVMAK